MSYLLENSLIVIKKEYKDDEEKYISYDAYEIDDRYILTQNDKPFFSIYDIAKYAKNKYTKNKLFLVAHRYHNNILKEITTEFYIFNTVDIFEKSLTSFLTITIDELVDKQHVIQNNIKIAKILLNCEDIHIILGDNIMLHEVVEYITSTNHNIQYDIFEENMYDKNYSHNNESLEYIIPKSISYSNISKVLKSVRVLEPKGNKIKKLVVLLIVILVAVTISQDLTDSFFEDYKYKLKKENKNLHNNLNIVRNNFTKNEKYSKVFIRKLQSLTRKDIYKPGSK
ncbi:MAG TPA: hypothetical protein EYG73_00050 [Arcobacter sp.]|nr:hypothetical protein [Arcobacter sp.]